jgi:hypothetical protein
MTAAHSAGDAPRGDATVDVVELNRCSLWVLRGS